MIEVCASLSLDVRPDLKGMAHFPNDAERDAMWSSNHKKKQQLDCCRQTAGRKSMETTADN